MDNNEARMTFFEHLDELRKRLTIMAIAYMLGVAVSYPLLFEWILELFLEPAKGQPLHYFSPLEAFLVRLKLSLFAAFVITSPITFYHILAFLSPALKKNERRALYFAVLSIASLFIFGVWLGYVYILPVGVAWLMQQGSGVIQPMFRATDYVSTISWFLISFGLAFQLPVIIVALVKLGIMSEQSIQKNWRAVYVVILVSAAILTPDHGPITMLMLAGPMIFLYHATVAYFYIPRIKKLFALKWPVKKS